MTREHFEELVADALDEVPEELLGLMSNVVILVEDDPPQGEPDLLGLYEGHALTDRGWGYPAYCRTGSSSTDVRSCGSATTTTMSSMRWR